MDSTRQQKIARLIQKEVGEIFISEIKNSLGPTLVTITKATVTSDLSIARIYLSIFGNVNKNDTLKLVDVHNKEIRRALGIRLRNQLRIIPSLEFYVDDSLDYIENIEKLLKQ